MSKGQCILPTHCCPSCHLGYWPRTLFTFRSCPSAQLGSPWSPLSPAPKLWLSSLGQSSSYSFLLLTLDTGPHNPRVQAPGRLCTLRRQGGIPVTSLEMYHVLAEKPPVPPPRGSDLKSLYLALQTLYSSTSTNVSGPLSLTPFQI